MINYYHRFLPKIAGQLHALHAASSGRGQSFKWSPDCQNAFEKAKSALAEATLLHHPCPAAPTSITTDASGTSISGQIEQRHGGLWRPIAFFFRKLSPAETKYAAFDRELLAVFCAIKHFRHFLEGRPFTAYTDHKPLTNAIDSATERSPRQTRHCPSSLSSRLTNNMSQASTMLLQTLSPRFVQSRHQESTWTAWQPPRQLGKKLRPTRQLSQA